MPEAWKDDFAAESAETAAKMNELKEWIRNNDFRVTEKSVQDPDYF